MIEILRNIDEMLQTGREAIDYIMQEEDVVKSFHLLVDLTEVLVEIQNALEPYKNEAEINELNAKLLNVIKLMSDISDAYEKADYESYNALIINNLLPSYTVLHLGFKRLSINFN